MTARSGEREIALFPLRTVLYPGGPLPLRIFETRYIDMISRCASADEEFGVVLIREGAEDGPTQFHVVGTFARIVDWYQGTDGLLGITAVGRQRFEVQSHRVAKDGLNIGVVTTIAPEPTETLPSAFASMGKILEAVLDDLGHHYETIERKFTDASWVGYRFAEVLPLDAEQKQQLLELNDPVARLELLLPVLEQIGTDSV